MLTDKETATILFALRYFQQEMGDEHEDNLIDPNGYFADHTPLASDEIDSLCERLNTPKGDQRLVGCREVLQSVKDIIAFTYAHDEDGEPVDEPGEHSAADIVEMLCGIEPEVDEALNSLG